MVLDTLRFAVFGFFVFSGLVALGDWALRARRLDNVSPLGRLVRSVTDRVLGPIETWQLRRGGNPQNAGWWLLGIAVVGGIVLLTAAEWLLDAAARMTGVARQGPLGVVRMTVFYAGQLVLIALIVRVAGSWFGAGRFNPWVRWSYALTDWIVEPLRRIIPPFGIIDVTPIVAWLLIQFLILPVLLAVLGGFAG